ncbi:MAG: TolC family protein [Desulfuromonadaceae bacterium]|nr:TolC family protein [Desulfuromonadaceae bacterium]
MKPFTVLHLFGFAALVLAAGCLPLANWPPLPESLDRQSHVEKPFEKVTPVTFRLPENSVPPVSSPADAEEPLQLSIEQAVLLVLKNNRDLQARQLTPVIAGTFERIERGVFDPELFGEAQYFREKASETSRSSGGLYQVAGKETLATTGLRQFLPTGTTVEAGLSHERTISDREPELQMTRAGLTVTQSLLQGLGPGVNLVAVRQAELETLASMDELRGFTEALLAETETAYWNYVLAGEKIAIFEESLRVARKQREEIELRIEVGVLPEIEVAAARAEEALRVQALIDARSQLEDRRLRLLRLISPSANGDLDQRFEAVSEPRLELKPVEDLQDRLLLAEKSRPDLSEARLRLQQNRLETIFTRNGLLPRLDFFIALGKTGYADTFSDAFRELDANTYDFTVGVRLSHILGNRAAKAKDLAAQASRQQAAAAIDNLRQLVHLDVRLGVNEVERTRQQIGATRETRIFQEQTLAAEKERFDVGTSTALEVAQAQRDLLQIQIAEVETIVNYRIALVRLYLAEGSLLGRRGVSIQR